MKRWISVSTILIVALLLTLTIVDLTFTWAAAQESIAPTATPVTSQPGLLGEREIVSESGQQAQQPLDPAWGQFEGSAGGPATQTSADYPMPTPVIPGLDWDPEAVYEIEEERIIGPYVIRVWRNTTSEMLMNFDSIATIQTMGQPMIQVDMAPGLHDLTGRDITGEGNPDVVIETYSGGAHCCFSTIVYDLGPTPTEVLRTPESNCSGYFEDLDNDSVLEFITCDDLFSYQYCCFAGSPAVKVIMKYYPGDGYLPASTSFRRLYAEDITNHTAAAEKAPPGEYCEWDETNKCAVLPVVLDYLYSGQWDMAWSELDRLYPHADRETFKEEIIQAAGMSELYVFP
jgi:hypothetical protein